VYAEALGPLAGEERSLWCTLTLGADADHLEALSRTALADIPAGPAWLREVNLVGYDYFSHGGTGWYADLDTLADWIAPDDRHRVAVTLHAWYDLVGRYAYDHAARDLLPRWTIFPNQEVDQSRFPTSHPVEIDVDEIRRRIAYAKGLGFRCLLYFADGLNACAGAWGPADGQRTRCPGDAQTWTGPDTLGEPLIMNPAHPDVRAWWYGYIAALLRRFGDLIDGLVWCEKGASRGGRPGGERHVEAERL